jgi:hypothetical protein
MRKDLFGLWECGIVVRVCDTKAVVGDGRLRHYVTSARVGAEHASYRDDKAVLVAEHTRFKHK